MTNKLDYKTILAVSVLIAVVGIFSIIWQQPWKAYGNVPESDACNATTTGAATYSLSATTTTLKRGSGVLCSAIVTGGGAVNTGSIGFYNATTSNINLRTGNIASSTLFLGSIPVSATSSTYAFNVNFSTGLVVVIESVPATSTISWK